MYEKSYESFAKSMIRKMFLKEENKFVINLKKMEYCSEEEDSYGIKGLVESINR